MVIIVGHLTLDNLILHQSRESFFDVPQGNALGAALGSSIWTDDIRIVSIAGRDYPQSILDSLKLCEIDTQGIAFRNLQSPRFWILRESPNTYQDYLFSGQDLLALTPTIDDVPTTYQFPVAVHVAPMAIERQSTFVTYYRNRGAVISIDPQPIGYVENRSIFLDWLEKMLPLVDIFSPSWNDIHPILDNGINPKIAGRYFLKLGCRNVAIRLGRHGSLLFSDQTDEIIEIPAYPTSPKEETGAGDSYCGAMLACYANKYSLLESGLAASAVASVMIEQVGMMHLINEKETVRQRFTALSIKLKE